MTDLRTPPVSDGDLFSERVRQFAYERTAGRLSVLWAGCGWGGGPDLRALDLGSLDLHITGVDLDTPQLTAATEARPDLDAWHLGDLRTVPMPPRVYDVVHVSYLVERVRNVELVLDRMVASLKPGGLLLVRLRDRDTAAGLLDRTMPAALRRGGGGPATVYERLASRSGIHWYCSMRGLVIAEEHLGQGAAWSRSARLVERLSRGRVRAAHSEVSFVIRKPENRFARVI